MKRLLSSVMSILLLPDFAAAQEPNGPSVAALAEARALVKSGNPAAAVAKLQSLSPTTDPLVAQLLGVAYYNR